MVIAWYAYEKPYFGHSDNTIPCMFLSIIVAVSLPSTFHVCWVFFGVLVSLSSEMGSSEMWACDTHRIIVHASAFQLNLLSNYLDNIFEHHRCVDFLLSTVCTFYACMKYWNDRLCSIQPENACMEYCIPQCYVHKGTVHSKMKPFWKLTHLRLSKMSLFLHWSRFRENFV